MSRDSRSLDVLKHLGVNIPETKYMLWGAKSIAVEVKSVRHLSGRL